MNDSKEQLHAALMRLEISTKKIVETLGYSKDAKSLKALEETVKEQLTNANSRSATRPIR